MGLGVGHATGPQLDLKADLLVVGMAHHYLNLLRRGRAIG